MAMIDQYPTGAMRPALPGMPANTRPKDTISRILETGTLAFGKPAFQGTADNEVSATPADGAFRGIAVRDVTLVHNPPNVDKYVEGETVGLFVEGPIWVTNDSGGAVSAGDPVYVTPAGAYASVAGVGDANTRLGTSIWDTSAANGGLARIEVKK